MRGLRLRGPGRRRRRPARPGVLALLVALVGLLCVAPALLAPPPAAADDGDLVVTIDGVSPAVVRTGDVLTITGTIRNTTDAELEAPGVRLLLQRHVPASTDALQGWDDGTSTLNVAALTGWAPQEDTLPPRGEGDFEIEIETEGTFGIASAWGPRGIEIQAQTGDAFGSARTTLLWFPSESPIAAPAELTLLVPLTPTLDEWREAVRTEVPVGDVAAPRLLEVLDAVGPAASLAVDPALLDDAVPGAVPVTATDDEADDDGGETPGEPSDTADPTDGEDPTTGDDGPGGGAGADGGDGEEPDGADARADLIDRLARTDSRRDLVALGYADADLGALAEHGGDALWAAGSERGRSLFAAAGLRVEDVLWPAGGLTEDALDLLAGAGTEVVVLDDDDVATTEAGRARVQLGDGGLDGLVADDALGQALTSGTGATARQQVLALSAVMTRALPEDPGAVLVVLPRDVGQDDLDGLEERVSALGDAPWLESANLRSLLGRTGQDSASLDVPVVGDDGLTAPAVTELVAAQGVVDAYAAAAGPEIEDAYGPGLLLPLSATLAGDPAAREPLLDAAAEATDQLASSIRIADSSSVLFINDAGSMPVTISNDLPVEVDVFVELVPEASALQVGEVPQHTVPAGGTETVRVPITAVANGDVRVDVRVLPTEDGPDLAAPAAFTVRIRAEWENIGTGAVAGLLLVAFVVGLIRTIRRNGRRGAAT